LYTSLDDFVVTSLSEFQKKKLVSIESASVSASIKKDANAEPSVCLSAEDTKNLSAWIKESLGGRVSNVKTSNRLVDSPAIIVDHESAAFRRMMKYVDPQRAPQLPKQQLEINPGHEIIMKLNTTRVSNPDLAKLIVEQIFDDALVSAGLMDDSRSMLPRINKILVQLLSKS